MCALYSVDESKTWIFAERKPVVVIIVDKNGSCHIDNSVELASRVEKTML
jgi:hypothetical protein